jgi:cation transport ATPase
MSDNLRNIPFAISISRHARTVIWQNLSIAVSVIVTLVISALGFSLALLVMKAARCSFVSMVCGSWHSAQMEFLTGLTLGYENSFVRIASDHPLGLASE